MARRTRRPVPTHHQFLAPLRTRCPQCQGPLWAAYLNPRTVTTLRGVYRLTLRVRRLLPLSSAVPARGRKWLGLAPW